LKKVEVVVWECILAVVGRVMQVVVESS
jgi:hypothetical protein